LALRARRAAGARWRAAGRVRPGQPPPRPLRRRRPGRAGSGRRRVPGIAEVTAGLRNIGPKTTALLRQVRLHRRADLRGADSVEAFLRVRRAGFKPTLNLLYSLEGALQGCHWQSLPREQREALAAEVERASQEEADPADPKVAGPVRTTVHVADTLPA